MTVAEPPLEASELRRQVDSIEWYHTLDFAQGVTTPGWLDHRPILDRIPLPGSLEGQRCLDVGTFNGFWAFEMERRGAREVIGIDVLDPARWDWPVGSDPALLATLSDRMADGVGFELARRALGSSVSRLDRSVYELAEQDVGRFDTVYAGSLLIHLRDPVRALERIRDVCDGTLVLVDGIDLALTLQARRTPAARIDGRGRPWWWYPNLPGLARMVQAGGFELVAPPRHLFIPPGEGWLARRRDLRLVRSREGRRLLAATWLGDPHGVILARPRR
jgi:tRNA (mo5U34)-methyltransferase